MLDLPMEKHYGDLGSRWQFLQNVYPPMSFVPLCYYACMRYITSLQFQLMRNEHLLICSQLFTETESPDSWMKHAKGLGQLVKIRGPGRYNNKLDMTLLRAARGLIVSSFPS